MLFRFLINSPIASKRSEFPCIRAVVCIIITRHFTYCPFFNSEATKLALWWQIADKYIVSLLIVFNILSLYEFMFLTVIQNVWIRGYLKENEYFL